MATDFNDEQQVQTFRDLALKEGKDIARVDAFILRKKGGSRTIQKGETLSGIARQTGSTVGELARRNKIQDPNKIVAGQTLNVPGQTFPTLKAGTGEILPGKNRLTQRFGNRNPIEKFSGGVNRGVDFGVPRGTAVSVPQGDWVVVEAFGGAREGRRNTNSGYGNSVKLKNRKTGETLRFSHLSKVGVRPGQTVSGGQVVATSGNTGNSTGPHLDIEMTDGRGRLVDITKSRYGQTI